MICFFAFIACDKVADVLPVEDTLGKVLSPKADFYATRIEGLSPDTITFRNLSQNVLVQDTSVVYNWSFKGGVPATSTKRDCEVVYTQPGDYDVTLILKKGTKSDTITKKAYIKIRSVPTDHLLLYYDFNNNLLNSVSNLNSGSCQYPIYSDSRDAILKKAFSFQGYSYYTITSGDNPISVGGSFTFSALIYPTSSLIAGYSPNDNQYIVSAGAQSGSTGYYLLWNNGRLRYGRKTPTAGCDTIFGSFPPNKWYHIVASYDSVSQSSRIYVNTKLVVESKNVIRTGVPLLANNFKLLTFGAPNTPYIGYFVGQMDEVRLYNRSLQEEEVKAFK